MIEFVTWCSICSSERAVGSVELLVNEQWVNLDVGEQCLTTLREDDRLDM